MWPTTGASRVDGRLAAASLAIPECLAGIRPVAPSLVPCTPARAASVRASTMGVSLTRRGGPGSRERIRIVGIQRRKDVVTRQGWHSPRKPGRAPRADTREDVTTQQPRRVSELQKLFAEDTMSNDSRAPSSSRPLEGNELDSTEGCPPAAQNVSWTGSMIMSP